MELSILWGLQLMCGITQSYKRDVSVVPCHLWVHLMKPGSNKQTYKSNKRETKKKNGRSSPIKSLVSHIAAQRCCNILMIPRTVRPPKNISSASHHQKARRNGCSQGWTMHNPGWLKRLWTQDSSLFFIQGWKGAFKMHKTSSPQVSSGTLL